MCVVIVTLFDIACITIVYFGRYDFFKKLDLLLIILFWYLDLFMQWLFHFTDNASPHFLNFFLFH